MTKTNWEALMTAHIQALTRLIEQSADPEVRAMGERALAQVRNPA